MGPFVQYCKHCGIISSCQSSATSKIVKIVSAAGLASTRVSSTTASTQTFFPVTETQFSLCVWMHLSVCISEDM